MRARFLLWIPFAFLALAVGLYPLLYFVGDMRGKGLLSGKAADVVTSRAWLTAFYFHISAGGIALLTGWSQFSARWRNRHLVFHRRLGQLYLIGVLLSSTAGFYIALFADGGAWCNVGFGLLAVLWFESAVKAYTSIRRRDINRHRDWMTVNYALTFAAVTLRIYLPLLQAFVFHDFIVAYRVVAWLCWVPNLLVAAAIIRRRRKLPIKA